VLNSPPKKDGHVTPQMLTEFVHCLHRVAKIGNYYPSGHAIVDHAAESFLVALGKIAQANSTVELNVQEDCLVVDAIRVETNTQSKTELLKILQEAAVDSITISRHATTEETLEFVRLILQHRAQRRNSANFALADLSAMPQSFRVRDKRFLVDKTSVISNQSDQDNENRMNDLLHALETKGLTTEQTSQCRTLLNSLQQNYQPVSNSNSLVQFTWNDVQNLLLRLLQNKPGSDLRSNRIQNDINTLTTIFSHLEARTGDKKAKESIGFLISLVKDQPAPLNKEKKIQPKKRTGDQSPELPIEELQSFVDKTALPPAMLKKLCQTDKAEEISVLLQLLQHEQTLEAMRNINRFFHDIFKRMLTSKEQLALLSGTRLFLDRNLNNRLEQILPPLVLIMRQSNHFSSLDFLAQLIKDISRQQLYLLWPVIVNELMAVGMGEKTKVYIHLMLSCSQLSRQEMIQRQDRLESLDSFQKNRTAAAIYPGGYTQIQQLFAFLLGTSLKKTIYQVILPVLQKTPPDPLGLAVLPFLADDERHLNFLQLYFFQGSQNQLSPSMRKVAGNILREGLSTFPEERMEEQWVSQAISYCGQMPVEGMEEMLEEIISAKKMLIMALWPPLCRQAAERALKQLKNMVKR